MTEPDRDAVIVPLRLVKHGGHQADEQPRVAAGQRHRNPRRSIRELLAPILRYAETARRPRILLRRLAVLAGLSILGGWRLFGGFWRWVTAADLALSNATQSAFTQHATLVEQVRQRRRRLTWLLTVLLAMVGTYCWFWRRTQLYAACAILAGVCTVVCAVLEACFRRGKAVEAGRVALGHHPGSKSVRRAMSHAGLAKNIDDVRVVGPVTRFGASWTAVVELPPGTPARKAVTRRAELAGAVGVDVSQVFLDRVSGNEGRVTLQVFDHDPLSGPPVRTSLLTRTTPFDAWTEKVTVGVNVRGEPVDFSPVYRSLLVGGEPGGGKSVGCNNVLCTLALDPYVVMWVIDGKGGADLLDYEPIANRFLVEPDPKACLDLLAEAQDDMSDTYRKLRSVGAKKITAEVAQALDLRIRLIHVDELQFFVASDQGKAIVNALWDLVSRGRAAGVILSAATQRPSGDVIPTKLRDIMSIRWSMRCTTNAASDCVMGQGWASKGYDASNIDASQRGASYLLAEGSMPVALRTLFIDDDDVPRIIRRAYDFREKAGTLPMSDARPEVRLLKALLRAFDEQETGRLFTTDVLTALTQHADYADWDAEKLADTLRAIKVAPKNLRIGEVSGRKGYERTDILRALERDA